MRKYKETILLAKIRRLIREACRWYHLDDGMPTHYSNLNWRRAKKMKGLILTKKEKDYEYYTRSSRAIEEIAIKILKEAKINLSNLEEENKLIIKFMHKYNFLTEEERKEVACRFDYVTRKEGLLIKDDPFSWGVVYMELINNTKLSKKMLRHVKYDDD